MTLENVRIVDETADRCGTVIVEDGVVREIVLASSTPGASSRVLMPAFVDLHAHFRDPGFTEKESLETACRAAAAGGYGTVVCMANTKPVTDTIEKARAIKTRADALGIIDVYPALSLTRNMEGKELAQLENISCDVVRLLSEDGKDVNDDALFLEAMKQAARLGLPVSLHCDLGGEDAATERAIRLLFTAKANNANVHVHIAHVSTAQSVQLVREAKRAGANITCEATPHHIALTRLDADRLGSGTFGKVAPPLRAESDRQAVIAGLLDGTIDAIATDHAPHTMDNKAHGSPGFTGLETAFAVCYSVLVRSGFMDLKRLSALMSANPARILGFTDRGRIEAGCRADFALVDTESAWTVDPAQFESRGKNTPFAGRVLYGKATYLIGTPNLPPVSHPAFQSPHSAPLPPPQ